MGLNHKKPDVRAKKHLGQHFLIDQNIARNTAEAIRLDAGRKVMEVGPGMGVLTQYLLQHPIDLRVVEIDRESVAYLNQHFPALEGRVLEADFLRMPLRDYLDAHGAVIGNFPYNISSQILFHCLENHDVVEEVCGMFQKEVAERVAAPHGNKTYGILSVLLQTYYKVDYLFTVHEHVFNPPPKVKSAVIRLTRLDVVDLPVPYAFFAKVVKLAFNQRRKTLRNALKPMLQKPEKVEEFLALRAEQLSVADFKRLAAGLMPE